MANLTLYDKIWQDHIVTSFEDGSSLLYIDCQLLHEVTSPQAFEGLKLNKRPLWSVQANVAVPDHNVPTDDRNVISDDIARIQIETLDKNCQEHNVLEFDLNDIRQGIVHVVGPEQGITLPGMTIVCGDSHTSTHGAFGAIAMGIGTSEVEHVMATQCLKANKLKNMRVWFNGKLPTGVYAKDMILALIGRIGTAGGTGHAIEFAGEAIANLTMEERMTICNMTIEAGARCGLIAVDETTINYVKDKPFAPKGAMWDKANAYWQHLHSDDGALFDQEVVIDASELEPQVSWGTSPEMVLGVNGSIPSPNDAKDAIQKEHIERAIAYMGLKPKQAIRDIPLDRVFIGSCTNSRIEDLRQAAGMIRGQKVAKTVKQAMVVPGSGLVKKQAEAEGLDKIFLEAGFEWRNPGCSMCLAMNPDKLEPGEHCASTSNRNFEGRQGQGGRTHLCSPATAAMAAIAGHFVDIREAL